jgi:hypothetical protein
LILVGVVALLAIGAWRKFSGSIRGKVSQQARTVATLEADPRSPVLPGGGLRVIQDICFAAGTLVATAAGPSPIERIHEGDLIWSRDEVSGDIALRPVLQRHVTPGQTLMTLVASAGSGDAETLRVTAAHRFWSTARGWVGAKDLGSGDRLWSLDGAPFEVVSQSSSLERQTVYSLDVDGYHTFFVGKQGIWVHNGPDPGLDCNGNPLPLGRGSTADPAKGTTLPRDLREQLAMQQAIANAGGGTQLPITMTDPRWPATDGWVKMQQNIEPGGSGGPVNVHYVYNPTTGQVDDFKIVMPGPRPQPPSPAGSP